MKKSANRRKYSTISFVIQKKQNTASNRDLAKITPFRATRNMFASYLDNKLNYSYDEWMQLPEENQVAALYVCFYPQIILAWNKVHSLIGEEEEGVETIIQYLDKNVPILHEHPERYNRRYIYRVAYNCLYCICHDRKIDKDRWALEMSNIQKDRIDGFFDFFDIVGAPSDQTDYLELSERDEFWKAIESVSEDALDIACKLINNESLGRSKAAKDHAQEVIEQMKETLTEFALEKV